MVMQENKETKNDLETEKATKKRKSSPASEGVPVAKITKPEDEVPQSKEASKEEHKKNGKRHKKRKKNYFNTIRSQMEFYFGDANLSKDRFLKKLITQEPFVPLEVFMTFNKMKTICKSVEEIAKSLSNSELLELDESGLKVRRKTNLPEERNVDAKTLYVESLPAIATHDWVREIFERFGPVTYVSLPKYKKSRKIKEFGFVEFENEESIQKAVESFKKFNGVLNTAETDPAELTSVKSFVEEQNEQIKQEKGEESEKAETSTKNSDADDENEKDIKQKRKKCKSANKELEPLSKRIKKEETESETESAINSQSSVASGTDTDVKVEGDAVDKQKKKKHKKKDKSLKERKRDTELIAEAAYFELKILPKRDWKRLRNKYLNLQRQRVGELKRKAWRERQEQQQQQLTNETVDDEYADNETKKCSKSTLKTGMNMNFYGAGDDEGIQKTMKQNAALEKPPLFSYEPGLIVEVSLQEPCINLKEFKANMRQYPTVKYVDIKEGAILAHLRLESATAAVEFVQRMNSADHGCKVLIGELEKTYWQKIEKDREAKLNKQVKLPQKRGREKIKKLISQHIRFGDEN